MKRVFLGLGSNLGDKVGNLQKAKVRIGESIGPVVLVSSVYETEPWGFESENYFLNMALCVETDLSPSGLLGRVLMIESELGRIRGETKYSSRTIDIDILLYNREIINEEVLIIPHPRMTERRFAMVPMVEIAPDLIHPVLKKSLRILLEECKDNSKVVRYKE
jgi:2-amino-4-hydroxy-6-hydroxymethyldihydropteridine diphosphokinase